MLASILIAFISAVFINNFVVVKFLGICPFLGVSRNMKTAAGMGAAVIFVMTFRISGHMGGAGIPAEAAWAGVPTDNSVHPRHRSVGTARGNGAPEIQPASLQGAGSLPAPYHDELRRAWRMPSQPGDPGQRQVPDVYAERRVFGSRLHTGDSAVCRYQGTSRDFEYPQVPRRFPDIADRCVPCVAGILRVQGPVPGADVRIMQIS